MQADRKTAMRERERERKQNSNTVKYASETVKHREEGEIR